MHAPPSPIKKEIHLHHYAPAPPIKEVHVINDDPYRYRGSNNDYFRSMLHLAPLVMHPLPGAYVYHP